MQELKTEGVDSGQQLHDLKVVKGSTVTDLYGKNSIALPKAFMKNEIPASNKDIPRPEIVTHLIRIADRMHPFQDSYGRDH